jgi:hypothetical protein
MPERKDVCVAEMLRNLIFGKSGGQSRRDQSQFSIRRECGSSRSGAPDFAELLRGTVTVRTASVFRAVTSRS